MYDIADKIVNMDNEEMQILVREMLFISKTKAESLAFFLETEILDLNEVYDV